MRDSNVAGKCMSMTCSKGRLIVVLVVILVVCICIAGLATFLVITNPLSPSPEPEHLNGSEDTTAISSTKASDTTRKENQTTTASNITRKENQTTTGPETITKIPPSNIVTRTGSIPTSWTKAPSTTQISSSTVITFELSKKEVYIGDSGLSMSCNVSNHHRLARVEISSGRGTIASVTQQALYTSISGVTISQGSFVGENNASVRIVFTYNLNCKDSGIYNCKAIGNFTISSSISLITYRRPSKPTLVLSREIIAGKNTRDDLPFSCEGDVGFPAGNLVLQSNFTSLFNPQIRTNNVTISNETCHAFQKITFTFNFSSNWHNKEMICFAVNNKSLGQNETPPFDKQLVKVVPANYCPTTERRLIYHPYNCHNFVDCVNGFGSVNLCAHNLCFSVNQTEGCNYCNWSLCVVNITEKVCPGSGGEPLPYSGLRCSLYVNCTDRLVHECPWKECFNVSSKTCPSWNSTPTPTPNSTTDKTSTQAPSTTELPSSKVITFEMSKKEAYIGESGLSMTCNVSNHQHLTRVEISSRWEIIAGITQQLSNKNKPGVSISPGSFVKENNASLNIVFTYNLSCNDRGVYTCKAIGNSITSSSINLAIFDEPNIPTLTLSPRIVENEGTFEDRMFRCEGLVGKPGNQMFVEANVSSSFQKYDFPFVINNTEVGCNINQRYEFYHTFNMSWHGRSIRCAVKNPKTNATVRSMPQPLEIVPRNYCASYGEDNFYPHPYECNKYIRCYQYKIIGIGNCGKDTCFGVNQTLSGGCIFCIDVDLMCLTGSRNPAK